MPFSIAAFKKLAYIERPLNSQTHRRVFLYGKENADDYFVKSDSDSSGYWDYMLIYERPSEATMKTLAQMVDNPPQSDDVEVWRNGGRRTKTSIRKFGATFRIREFELEVSIYCSPLAVYITGYRRLPS